MKALKIRQQILSFDHNDVAISNANVAEVYSYLGDHLKSLEYYFRAFEIWKGPTNAMVNLEQKYLNSMLYSITYLSQMKKYRRPRVREYLRYIILKIIYYPC